MLRIKAEIRRCTDLGRWKLIFYKLRYPAVRWAKGVRIPGSLRIHGDVEVEIGSETVIEGALVIVGTGRVRIGQRARFGSANGPNRLDLCASGAIIDIGSRCFINGAKLVSRKRVTLGALCMLGD